MAVAILAMWALGVGLGYNDTLGLGPLAVSMFGIALFAFFGFLRAKADMRTAITASFVTVYFALLAALATSERNRTQFDTEVGQELWNNFTYLIGVIVLFYFGATTAIDITHKVKNSGPGSGGGQEVTKSTGTTDATNSSSIDQQV